VLGAGAGQLDERRQPAAAGPHQPAVEETQGAPGLAEVEDRAELLLQEVGALEAPVGLLDEGELALLAHGQVLGDLPERDPGVLELPGGLAAPSGRVPYVAPAGWWASTAPTLGCR
jgi:hypothetical protein